MANYVNNKDFFKAMKEWKDQCEVNTANGEGRPPLNNYIGECILQIANRLSLKPNFINYTYRDEMISDGIENAIMYSHNFNPAKSDNPFAYFTQIIYFAFVRRIQKEKKQQHVKHSIISNMSVDGDTDREAAEMVEYLQKNYVPETPVYKVKKGSPKPEKKAPTGLEDFYVK